MSFLSSIGSLLGVAAAPFTGGASLIPSVIGAGASILGGVLQNNSAKSLAKSSNAQAIELANTQHQREVKDLQAAGLNPILSAGGSGAAVPSMQTPQVGNILGSAVAGARAASLMKHEVDKAKWDAQTAEGNSTIAANTTHQQAAQLEQTRAQTALIKAQTLGAANSARSSAVEAQSAEDMGALTRNLEKGGAVASQLANVIKIMRQLGH